VVADPADAAIHAVCIIVHPSSGRKVRARAPIARWLTSSSADGSSICDIPRPGIFTREQAAIITAFRIGL
jgi:hypothetical protein